jgi:hypothetical protein
MGYGYLCMRDIILSFNKWHYLGTVISNRNISKWREHKIL